MSGTADFRNLLLEVYSNMNNVHRTELNREAHYVPLDLQLLEVMLSPYFEQDTITTVRLRLIKHLKNITSKVVISSGNTLTYNGKVLNRSNLKSSGALPLALVYRGGTLRGLLASNFNQVRDTIFKSFINSADIKDLLKDSKTKFDVGHTDISLSYGNNNGRLGQTVATYRANAVEDILVDTKNSAEITKYKKDVITSVLSQITKAQETLVGHATYAEVALGNIQKSFREGLLSINANIVFIQEASENRLWGSTIESAFSKKIAKILTQIKFSNNMLEEIGEQVALTLTGKKIRSTSASKSISATAKPANIAITSTNLPNTKLPPLRTKKGSFTSLTSIKNMINLQLMEQVAKNMGKGTAKSILNFRTGRFAASAHVEQLVRNKDASLTAYYTYLKYPYATFEPGGRQGYPESRDPRLLISKSIRQLAAQQMSERLKTICV